uniref:Cilia and flagella associated protein 92 (putative) n=1 Tax=Phocoena sinus TaxID=42100 RepID=A0A8C9EGE2_PHOSS
MWLSGAVSSMGSFYQSVSECEVEENLKVRAWAQESATGHQCSGESSEGPASTFDSDVPHVVPCKFIISLAFPVTAGHKGKCSSLVEKYRRHPKMDKPIAKVRHYYHIEYFLLPDDGEPKKVDVVVFPALAKVFLDSGIKTIRPWQEGDKVWVSWTQSFNINMTKELLKKINFHKITLRLWDTKDKVSKKAKNYQLKPSGFLEDAGSFGKFEVKHLVLSQRRSSDKGIHVKEKLHQDHTPGKPEKARKCLRSGHGEWRPRQGRWLVGVAGVPHVHWRPPRACVKRKESDARRKSQRRREKSRLETDSRLAGHGKQGTFAMQLAVMPLLAGWQTVVSHGSGRSANVLDCLLTLKTEVPLMTEEQKRDLNPLTIEVKCVSCLPSRSVSFSELERLCTPVYCRYQFHRTPVHRTEGQPHGTRVYFQDINVIFLGAMHPSDLREYLEGPPMVVEVHDRDRKSEEYSHKPALFGEDPLDSYLNLQTLISPKETENNPFETQDKMWDPYGVAQVSFADLLRGHKYLNLVVPVHSCEPKATRLGHDSRSRKVVGLQVPGDGLRHGPMPPGDYLEASCQLKLRAGVAVPLRAGTEALDANPTASRFGRVIFVFTSSKLSLLHGLLQDVTVINAGALGLDSCPVEDIQQILSTLKMPAKIQERPDLDVLTGFHLLDGRGHLLILEGLADRGLRRLWESHQSRVPRAEPGSYKALYNSQLRFRHRLYADLETVPYHVHLSRPLAQLVKHAVLYVRNTVPRQVFQALSRPSGPLLCSRIYCICHYSSRLREVITGDLLPSSSMIKELSQEFGLPISQEDLTEGKLLAMSPPPAPNLEDFQSQNSTLTSEIQARQEKYLQWQNTVILKNRDQKYSPIQNNISGAYEVSKKSPESVVKVTKISAPAKDAVYNYSIQTLNSTELAKEELHREMAKEPRKRLTDSQSYLSATVEPQGSDEEKRKSRDAWLTPNGVQVTSLHSTGRTHHLGLPPLGTVTEEWREKALFANILEPVLHRESWGWDRRPQDFDVYTQPPPFLELPSSSSPVCEEGPEIIYRQRTKPVN